MERKDEVLKDLKKRFGFDPRQPLFDEEILRQITDHIATNYPEFSATDIDISIHDGNWGSFNRSNCSIPFSINFFAKNHAPTDYQWQFYNFIRDISGRLIFYSQDKYFKINFLGGGVKEISFVATLEKAKIFELEVKNTIFENLDLREVEVGEGGFVLKIAREANVNEEHINSKIYFDNSCFKGRVILIDLGLNNKKRKVEISLSHAIFERPATFNLPFAKCPDFSKAHFLSGVIIEDTWPKINEVKITAADEGKFRFLKNYFAKANNHLKEQEYFRYEMLAKAKALKGELRKELGISAKNISKESVDCRVAALLAMTSLLPSKPWYWLRQSWLGQAIIKHINLSSSQSPTSAVKHSNLSSSQSHAPSLRGAQRRGNLCLFSKLKSEYIKFIIRVKNFGKINCQKKPREDFWQRRLIKIYERFSKFGSSIARPIAAQVVIFIVFLLIYRWFFCVDLAQSFWASLIKTLVPITNMKDLLPIDESWKLSVTTTIHGLLSAIFLFLLLLAIRNRFKIK